ncbi:MAG TPA: pyruvate:ferredoxin (flavodoxin) oxidoreductase [Blastocatellia bacterium]|nr:pyruvate:ferredoxin (flavodoxin) oxidoreductase [Blastocatellia bacterium]
MSRETVTIDGNEAAAYIAYKTNEVAAIYPITPSSGMGELSDAWAAEGKTNIWGMPVIVREMQSEGGAAGVVHGALQAGALTTTFTSSQGLLLMIPNMFKIAGELTSTVFHIAARSVASHALSIFGDHSDVMAARSAGWGMLFAGSVQEVMDFALIAQAVTLKARVPFLHVFDGFRTSHEVAKIERLSDECIRELIDDTLVEEHRRRALSPDRPFIRGTAQNPDVFFQSRERINPFYQNTPPITQEVMNRFEAITGRPYRLFDYCGAPDAERVIVIMGSGGETVRETVEYLASRGEKVGLIRVRLFRPFSYSDFLKAAPVTARTLVVLDRTKEAGAAGEPLYQDVCTALSEAQLEEVIPFNELPRVIGGRYGLGSKEFTPAMVKAALDEALKPNPKNHFTVGIEDDVSNTSLVSDQWFDTEPKDRVRAVFWGLGADGTVSANKNSVKIIGEETPHHAQGYFVYDSKKSGAVTVSHLRFGDAAIHSAYLIREAEFVAVHQFNFFERYGVLELAKPGATLLINSPFGKDQVWSELPREVQQQIIDKELRVFVVDAFEIARDAGLGKRINTIMQTCFFALSGVLPREEAIARIKESIKKTYGKRGDAVLQQNFQAVDSTIERLEEVLIPEFATSTITTRPAVPTGAPDFVQRVTAQIIAGRGNSLPVSAFPEDGTYPSGTTKWEKRGITQQVPVWETDLCIQCGKCVMVCPHSCIRGKVYDEGLLGSSPETFKHMPAKWRELKGDEYTIQVSVEDCTGCELCVDICPAVDKRDPSRKSLNMSPQHPLREAERENWEFFSSIPDVARGGPLTFTTVKNVQLLPPLFEFSGACSGCGETPYIKLLTQLFGDHSIIANATGCSSIYGGNLPTTPYTINREGRGPAWSNSLFEDNAEFGLGMRIALDHQNAYARALVERLKEIGADLAHRILTLDQRQEGAIELQRRQVAELKTVLAGLELKEARDLLAVADSLVKKDIWIVGGDGWAYDIGFGGLDHVLASGADVNILILDTEVYSNTGGQSSKATPLGAVARFAAGGKATPKKDIGMMAIQYGNVYVAQVAMGANDAHTLKAFLEAEAHPGPSLIVAYGHCIAHEIDMSKGLQHQKLAVDSGHWPLYRYNPAWASEGKNPFKLDSKGPSIPLSDYIYTEGRYSALRRSDPEVAEQLLKKAEKSLLDRWRHYTDLASDHTPRPD